MRIRWNESESEENFRMKKFIDYTIQLRDPGTHDQ